MEEIGGYIELEHYHLPMIHQKAIALNCGRNCLAYVIRARKIKIILLPKFICKSIIDICKREEVQVRYYSINEYLLPENIILQEEEWLYIINYYGQLSNQKIRMIYKKYHRVIIDHAQAYFQNPIKGIDTLYTCRKFFGVPDGAFLYTDYILEQDIPQDQSYKRMNFLMGRYEKTASEFYEEYSSNNEMFNGEPIKGMSKLTKNFLHSIDYKRVKKIRTENYEYLYQQFYSINKLELQKVKGAFMYPLYIRNGEFVRKKLKNRKIYIPILWPDTMDICIESDLEYQFAINILPIPCDQRYGKKEMEIIVEYILRYI